jgi:ferredoxin-NADP reductase
MKGWEVRFIEKIDQTEGIKSFRFERPSDLDYFPGQYFFISFHIGERTLMHHFSFSSSPTESQFIEFTTRIRDSEFKRTINKIPLRTIVQITEVHGEFTITSDMRKVVFICGGIGITAAISNIKWAADTKSEVDIVLLYANHDQKSVAFQDALNELSIEHLRVVHILSKPEVGWKGLRGHINTDLVQSQVPDWQERMFFVSGPPKMVETIKKVLIHGVGVSKDQLKMENYLGY